ncbi:MAG: hypothetical protein CSA33_06760 [Desulfobulbus propionicus]|nr:MAG: hypothetical protein CSA33_06760 [Desulfobulbus propionicus]
MDAGLSIIRGQHGLLMYLARIAHDSFVSFEKKETKTDGCAVRESSQISTNCSPMLSPGGTIFGSILAPHIPK